MDIRLLNDRDIPDILEMERRNFIVGMRANGEVVRRRLAWGHRMYGLFSNGELVAKICSHPLCFDPHDRERFPSTFEGFANVSGDGFTDANAVAVYDFDANRNIREYARASRFLKEVFGYFRHSGFRYVVGDGRMRSYAGSVETPEKRILLNDGFRNAIDTYFHGGPYPSDDEFCADPLLAFYRKATGCGFWDIRQEFISGDAPSGGMRTILVKDLQYPDLSLTEEWMELSAAMYGGQFISELAALFRGRRSFLEFGCGGGHVAEGLSRYFETVVGVDKDKAMISHALGQSIGGIDFRVSDWTAAPSFGRTFDVVMCRGNSLGHVVSWDGKNPDGRFGQISESLRTFWEHVSPGGLLYVDTVSEAELLRGGGAVSVSFPHIWLNGRIQYEKSRNGDDLRTVNGSGWVSGRYFSGGSTGFLIRPSELESLVWALDPAPSHVRFVRLEHEPNYAVLIAEK
ncbi:MAG: class I SAM-dependent methyltransferase [Candidatus Moranbacteria bacterium]|nr:class I SAM-dependent methyltransferase [Candidatus Moranbacteria bacterium]